MLKADSNLTFYFWLTHLSSQPLVQRWGSACRSWRRRSCTACMVRSCPPECVWCRTPGRPGGAESMVAGWRSRPEAPEDGESGSPGSDLMAKRGCVSCSLQICKIIRAETISTFIGLTERKNSTKNAKHSLVPASSMWGLATFLCLWR